MPRSLSLLCFLIRFLKLPPRPHPPVKQLFTIPTRWSYSLKTEKPHKIAFLGFMFSSMGGAIFVCLSFISSYKCKRDDLGILGRKYPRAILKQSGPESIWLSPEDSKEKNTALSPKLYFRRP